MATGGPWQAARCSQLMDMGTLMLFMDGGTSSGVWLPDR